jgi:hypothetical protein
MLVVTVTLEMGVGGQSHISDVRLVVTLPYTHLKCYGDHKPYITDMALPPYPYLKVLRSPQALRH